jgi:hypothetical protein
MKSPAPLETTKASMRRALEHGDDSWARSQPATFTEIPAAPGGAQRLGFPGLRGRTPFVSRSSLTQGTAESILVQSRSGLNSPRATVALHLGDRAVSGPCPGTPRRCTCAGRRTRSRSDTGRSPRGSTLHSSGSRRDCSSARSGGRRHSRSRRGRRSASRRTHSRWRSARDRRGSCSRVAAGARPGTGGDAEQRQADREDDVTEAHRNGTGVHVGSSCCAERIAPVWELLCPATCSSTRRAEPVPDRGEPYLERKEARLPAPPAEPPVDVAAVRARTMSAKRYS